MQRGAGSFMVAAGGVRATKGTWWAMGPFMLYARGERLGRQITLVASWRSSGGV